MDVTTFQCPHCHAALRMRGTQTAGTRFDCPDCSQPLQLIQTAEGQLAVNKIDPAPETRKPSELSHKAKAGLQTLHRGMQYLAASPVLVAWLVAGTGGLLILLMILLDDSRAIPQTDSPETVVETEEPADDSVSADEAPLMAELASEPESPEPAAPDTPPAPAPPEQKPMADQTLIAAKPEQIPPLVARKPTPAQTPDVPQTDVTVALQIPILEFRQPREIPLKTLIAQFEEMLDTEFEFADDVKKDSRLLETPVAFSQKNTTLSRLLTQILSEGALTFSVKSNKIYIEKAEAP